MVYVLSREGWCATTRKTAKYADRVKTVCGYYVFLPFAVSEERDSRGAHCRECAAALKVPVAASKKKKVTKKARKKS